MPKHRPKLHDLKKRVEDVIAKTLADGSNMYEDWDTTFEAPEPEEYVPPPPLPKRQRDEESDTEIENGTKQKKLKST